MTDELLDEFEDDVESWTLIPSSGGVYEFEADGELLYSKKETGRHATIEEVRASLQDYLGD